MFTLAAPLQLAAEEEEKGGLRGRVQVRNIIPALSSEAF